MKNNKFLVLLLFISILSCNQEKHISYDLVIENVSLFDGFENVGIVNIAIQGDTIAKISKDSIHGDSIISGKGKFIIPGLVNCHTHSWKLTDLQESYKAGVLTMVNLHQVSEKVDKSLKQYRDSLGYANLYSAGIAATVAKGHPTQYGEIETINDTITPEIFVENRIKNGADLIKVVRDNAATPPNFESIPTLSYEQIEELINAAYAKEKKVVVHIQQLKDLLKISEFKPSGFAHIWFINDDLNEDKLKTIKESGAFIIPTALTQQRILGFAKRDTDTHNNWTLNNLTSMDELKMELAKLHKIEVPLLAGTDPPNAGINYGDDLIKELFIYEEAGLTNIDVLKTATGNPSKYLDIDGQGHIKLGGSASFLLLNSDPMKDLNALSDIHSIWKNGNTE